MYDNCFCFIQGTKRDNVDKEDGNKSKKSKRLVFTRKMRPRRAKKWRLVK